NLSYTDTAPLPAGMAGVESWDDGAGWAIDHFSAGNLSAAPSAPVFTADSPPATASLGVPYTYTFAASGNPSPSFAVASGSLPAGFSLSAAGVLSGTPTVTGTATFSVSAANSAGTTTAGPLSITVSNTTVPPTFTADTPPTSATAGTAYSYTFAASGTPAPTFSVASGSLPAGLSLSAAGVLSGTPSTAGSSTFTVRASNSAGSVTSPNITVTVAAAATPPRFTAASPPSSGVVGTPYSYTFTASGTPAPTFSVFSGSLPAGLSLSSGGVLAGTPQAAGTFAFRVRASNSAGNATTGSLSILVTSDQVPPAFTSASPPGSATVGAPYSYTFAASGTPPPTFSIASGALPPGLTLDPTGVLSGTPTGTGSYSYRVQASNSAGSVTSGTFSISVFPAPAIAMAAGSIFAAAG
ncbi:MAG TPA: putative Ig domain-containing protein, partial [Actinomycetota bacterium]|nr:putative Ig domain-containing protein [Actinomycetota bacterium]